MPLGLNFRVLFVLAVTFAHLAHLAASKAATTSVSLAPSTPAASATNGSAVENTTAKTTTLITTTLTLTTANETNSTNTTTTTEFCAKPGKTCGGAYYSGPTCCQGNSTCEVVNSYFSMCSKPSKGKGGKGSCSTISQTCGGPYGPAKDCCSGLNCEQLGPYAPVKVCKAARPTPAPAASPVPAVALGSLQNNPAYAAEPSAKLSIVTMFAMCAVATLVIFVRSRMHRGMGLEEPLLMA